MPKLQEAEGKDSRIKRGMLMEERDSPLCSAVLLLRKRSARSVDTVVPQ